MNREKTLVCNGCGKLIKVENGLIREGVFRVNYDWGYFSEKDGERHIFCLCETCYDRDNTDVSCSGDSGRIFVAVRIIRKYGQ